MSTRIHTAWAEGVAVDALTDREVDQQIGSYEFFEEEADVVRVVLHDDGNQEAWVITGNMGELLRWCRRVVTAIEKVDGR